MNLTMVIGCQLLFKRATCFAVGIIKRKKKYLEMFLAKTKLLKELSLSALFQKCMINEKRIKYTEQLS